ncbi:MAG TPA: ERF family protein [Longimicrobiaceae bacterium]
MATEIIQHNEAALPVADEGGGEPGSVLALIKFGIERDMSVEALERLVALQERITDRNARTAFVEALAAFRQDCPPIAKTRENTQFSVTRNGTRRAGTYAPLEEIDRVARPVAAKHGLTWTWDTRVDDKLMHVSCRVMHVMGHSETTNVSMPFESKAGSSPQQKYGAAQTYGMRYSLIAALGITTADDDEDGNGQYSADTITDRQAADLDALIDEVGVDRVKFLRWLGVKELSDLRAADMGRAVKALESKRSA